MDCWYVLQTKPKREKDVASYLSTQEVTVFHPLIEEFFQRHGKTHRILKPLFPGYLFVRFDLERHYPLVRWARGVKKVLGCGSTPSPICEEAVELIRRRMGTDGTLRRASSFLPDDPVRIKSGPLRDLTGIFERWVSEGERVRVLLKLIGYQPSIELHYSMLEKAA